MNIQSLHLNQKYNKKNDIKTKYENSLKKNLLNRLKNKQVIIK